MQLLCHSSHLWEPESFHPIQVTASALNSKYICSGLSFYWLFKLRISIVFPTFFNWNIIYIVYFSIPCSIQLSLLYVITVTMLHKKYILWNLLLCNFLFSSVTSSFLDPHVLNSTWFSNAINLHSLFRVKGHFEPL